MRSGSGSIPVSVSPCSTSLDRKSRRSSAREVSRMNVRETLLPGLLELQPVVARDSRGTFVKTFHQDRYTELGLVTDFAEEYFSSSRCGVVRGMHFQIPPHDHAKVVYCITGNVMDVIVD